MSEGYRPEIDGLRAVAVVPVVLFHAGVPGFSKRGPGEVDFGDTDHIERVPDILPNDSIETW